VFFPIELPVFATFVPDRDRMRASGVPLTVVVGRQNRDTWFGAAATWLAEGASADLVELPGGHVGYGKDGSLALETLTTDEDEMTLSYRSPTHANLLANYDRVYITRAPEAAPATEIANVLMTGALPAQTLIHIRHVLVTFDTTPNKAGFALGLRQEADEILRHAELLKKIFDAGDLEGAKRHAEHLINMIEGRQGEHFGDSDGNGNIQNPGDGFGILKNGQQLGYLDGMVGHAVLAAETPDATENIKAQAESISLTRNP
jgi:hypothetical protein